MSKSNKRKKRLREMAIERQRGLCFYCSKPMVLAGVKDNHGLKATAEHLIRKTDGGTWSLGNIVAAHGLCNMKRNDRTVEEHKAKYVGRDLKFQYPASAIFWCD